MRPHLGRSRRGDVKPGGDAKCLVLMKSFSRPTTPAKATMIIKVNQHEKADFCGVTKNSPFFILLQ
jgi:hypothetical protein